MFQADLYGVSDILIFGRFFLEMNIIRGIRWNYAPGNRNIFLVRMKARANRKLASCVGTWLLTTFYLLGHKLISSGLWCHGFSFGCSPPRISHVNQRTVEMQGWPTCVLRSANVCTGVCSVHSAVVQDHSSCRLSLGRGINARTHSSASQPQLSRSARRVNGGLCGGCPES